MPYRRRALLALMTLAIGPAFAQTPAAREPMTLDRLDAVIRRLEPAAERLGGAWRFPIEGVVASVFTDENHDRMRVVIPVRPIDGLKAQDLYRLMQANFDSALDARYAIAQEMLWSTFIHPLRALDEAQFLAGLGQAINLVRNFGTSYSSGLLTFRGGDSNALVDRELIDRLLRRGGQI
ncbi:MAG: hypothetical protein FJX57_14915 [Alphaproteobacteria bacterium]|nr:hypothetical protein [Alphaproteobacteria bacterium]